MYSLRYFVDWCLSFRVFCVYLNLIVVCLFIACVMLDYLFARFGWCWFVWMWMFDCLFNSVVMLLQLGRCLLII